MNVANAARGEAALVVGGETLVLRPSFEALGPVRSRTGRHGAILLPLRTLLAALDSAE